MLAFHIGRLLRGDMPSLGAVELESKQVGSRIVTDRIEHSLAFSDEREVELGNGHPLAFFHRRA